MDEQKNKNFCWLSTEFCDFFFLVFYYFQYFKYFRHLGDRIKTCFQGAKDQFFRVKDQFLYGMVFY